MKKTYATIFFYQKNLEEKKLPKAIENLHDYTCSLFEICQKVTFEKFYKKRFFLRKLLFRLFEKWERTWCAGVF